MRTRKLADANYAEQIRCPLGTSLIRVTQIDNGTQTRPAKSAEVPGFSEWQEQWQSNNKLISQRLALIDAELERICRDDVAPPQLNVFQDMEAVG